MEKEEERSVTDHVLVEEVEHHSGQSTVGPVTMYQQELLQKVEPPHGKITRHHCLRTSQMKRLLV